jgi:hypothetical protein
MKNHRRQKTEEQQLIEKAVIPGKNFVFMGCKALHPPAPLTKGGRGVNGCRTEKFRMRYLLPTSVF